MCRFLAYHGEAIFLDELICKPRHSLVRQSLHADEAKAVTNGDGFGIGWYGEREQPAVYREVMPAWSDENLLSLCASVRSGLFFAHVRAATGTGIARQNCHPYTSGRWLFMHNGQVGGYSQIRRALEARVPDYLFAERRGATDSELLFLLIIARLDLGEDVAEAVVQVLKETLAMMRVLHVSAPLRFAAALSDGKQLHAFRWSSDKLAPTLYLHRTPAGDGLLVASEPLEDGQEGWEMMAPGTMVSLSSTGVVSRTLS